MLVNERRERKNGGTAMNRQVETFHTQPSPPLTMRQRIFVAVLLLLAIVLSFIVVRFIDPTASLTDRSCVRQLIHSDGTGAAVA